MIVLVRFFLKRTVVITNYHKPTHFKRRKQIFKPPEDRSGHLLPIPLFSPETFPRIHNLLGCLPHQNVTFAYCELVCMSDVRTGDREEHIRVESEANRLQLAPECRTGTHDATPDGVRPRLRSLFPMTSELVQADMDLRCAGRCPVHSFIIIWGPAKTKKSLEASPFCLKSPGFSARYRPGN